MQYTTLKKTDIRVSKIGIGTNRVGGHNIFPNLDETEGKNYIIEALHHGVNFIDTADYYGWGRSEELIGEVIHAVNIKREDLVISTKAGIQRDPQGNRKMNSRPEYLRAALESSLKRLGTDYIDLYFLHFADNETPVAESTGELARLKEEGKIRAIAASNLSLNQLKEAVSVTDISAYQDLYNMLERDIEKTILPFCLDNQISFLPYYPLSSGLLGGNYKIDDPPPKRFTKEGFQQKVQIVDQLKIIADAKGISLPNLALSWILAQEGIDIVIPGGRHSGHAQSNVKAADIQLTPSDLEAIENVLKDVIQS
ncbi:aldo/keto reductase [Neobacillus mesonae]|uniref:aldo/keto reductase n=1 Tax=Neobacillus mesonae TaxID=1193713 RepID=UPI00203FBFE1|nr:aldo/keto reductase [Neobacillus mesonae]MCM3567485.1 aldo/keto reductase [Neobacillus mesonae]